MTIPSIAEMTEIIKHAETCVLASELSGQPIKNIAQELFLGLPTEHFLLRDPWARYEFNAILRKRAERLYLEAKKFLDL